MKRTAFRATSETVEREWVALPGGELEGQRSHVLCQDCREKRARAARGELSESSGARAALCFACYRAGVERERAIKAAAERVTTSELQFQSSLPFEAVDRARLARLKVERATARAVAHAGAGQFVDRRRQAQIRARHALQRIAEGLRARHVPRADEDRERIAALHAAELQLPSAWLPLVAAR